MGQPCPDRCASGNWFKLISFHVHRYLKSIYPKAEEMLLLDILANADNNVQKASEKLTSMGYEKRDTTAPKQTNRNREEQVLKQKMEAENTPPPQPRLKSNEEKQKSKYLNYMLIISSLIWPNFMQFQ